jgi:hypothetical protein
LQVATSTKAGFVARLFALLEDCLASFRLFCVFMSCDEVDFLPAFRELPCLARLILASRPDTPTTMMMGLSGRYLFRFTRLQRIADMTGMEEALLILACAVLSLGWGYYCIRWPALAPLSALLARVLGWAMLALGLLLLYSGTQSIVEALL